jgi:excisionase family DNA binding protein
MTEFTTIEAAELLNVSHAYLLRLLEDGELPSHGQDELRRVPAADLLAYKEEYEARQQAAVDMLAGDSPAMGLDE